MDNTARSERTRNTVIQAALAIIARDGAGRLTLDAIAKEGGISKGALMHHFRTKEAVLKALMEHQMQDFAAVFEQIRAAQAADQPLPVLTSEIATLRSTLSHPNSVAFAVMGAVAQDPSLLGPTRAHDATRVAAIRDEAEDQDLSTLRWAAARGLALTSLLGLCPLGEEERGRLFDQLMDHTRWATLARPTHSAAGRKRKASAQASSST
ncbi:TetR/AcrR family transcriptional regulator [Roseomonas aerophila]|uniref:TetR/AcrR family transcriptional regulator n=1 Tax=Teichococcus aerophilus TaxID=1224513 RepID=A0ABR7RQB7_9PROT|nr:TetR/AcrR family transcriptional regulator [Pseudoroseomonas aerophila]MBC9208345.1 TetR/AcrR family transcriptional regulator [Pseudoroseomonas aerophila]